MRTVWRPRVCAGHIPRNDEEKANETLDNERVNSKQYQNERTMTKLVINTPLSCWIQLASLFFTLSGMHGDLLVIRLFLVIANMMLFINAVVGAPLWSTGVAKPGYISLDSITWAAVGIYLHGASFLHLLQDERPVTMTAEQEALWRMFYRTGGLSARLFQTIVMPHMEVVEYQGGEEILVDEYFYIVYHGRVNIKVYNVRNGELKVDRIIGSSRMFDIAYLGFFSEDNVFVQSNLRCWSMDNHTTLFRFSRSAMKRIAHHPFAKHVWQALLINNLSSIVESRERHGQVVDQCDSVFAPLEPSERPSQLSSGSEKALQSPVRHLLKYIHSSFCPPWPFGGHPAGIRHVSLPAPKQGTYKEATSLRTSSSLSADNERNGC